VSFITQRLHAQLFRFHVGLDFGLMCTVRVSKDADTRNKMSWPTWV
jgi:hypothetical protein